MKLIRLEGSKIYLAFYILLTFRKRDISAGQENYCVFGKFFEVEIFRDCYFIIFLLYYLLY